MAEPIHAAKQHRWSPSSLNRGLSGSERSRSWKCKGYTGPKVSENRLSIACHDRASAVLL
jgi:hypothetical protein